MSGGKVLAASLILAGAAGTGLARSRLVSYPESTASHDLLYLPNGRYLKAMSMGQAPVLADVLYLWAIQYYSDYERADRYRYVEHVFGTVITEINPQSVDPYWLGSMILTAEAGDLEGGLRLLDKGFARNPTQWILPYMAGWECDRAGEYKRAADYFERASRVPAAPAYVLRMRAGMLTRQGDLREAIRQWQDVYDHSSADAASRTIAERQVRDLTVRVDLEDLRSAVRSFREREGRAPLDLQEVVAAGILRTVPLDPDHVPYRYDRRTGEVESPAGRVLGDS